MKQSCEWRRRPSSSRRYLRAKHLALIAAGLLTTSACMPQRTAGPPTASVGTSSGNSEFSAPKASDCRLASPQPALAEVKGSNLWALVFAPLPITAGTDTKIVWRMGGHGDFQIAAKTTDAATARLTFGPEPHGGSTWYIPNTDEWGTGMIFPTPGCWRVHASRDGTRGDVYFLVVQP
jgi:hypothetical protein